MNIDPSKLGLIEFIDIPEGDFPLEIRKKWVGVQVPCLCFDPRNTTSRSLFTKQQLPLHQRYVVLQVHAVAAMAKKCPEAAHYMNHVGYPVDENALFSFNAECVKVIKPAVNRGEFGI